MRSARMLLPWPGQCTSKCFSIFRDSGCICFPGAHAHGSDMHCCFSPVFCISLTGITYCFYYDIRGIGKCCRNLETPCLLTRYRHACLLFFYFFIVHVIPWRTISTKYAASTTPENLLQRTSVLLVSGGITAHIIRQLRFHTVMSQFYNSRLCNNN